MRAELTLIRRRATWTMLYTGVCAGSLIGTSAGELFAALFIP